MIFRMIDRISRQQRMVEDLTKQIVERCETAVWARVRASATTMDPAQSRGYIRARAADIIRTEAETAVGDIVEANDSLLERVVRNTSDVIVRRIMATIATQHPAVLRRAA